MLARLHRYHLLELIFFAGVFFLTILPINDFDIWFHLKSGEIISKLGIIHYDVFSYNTNGREWFPYEWLFQWFLYQYQQLLGFEAIKYLVAVMSTIAIISLYLILRRVFKLNIYLGLILAFLFLASIFGFLTPRPQIFAYLFVIWEIGLLLSYYFSKNPSWTKHWLWLSLPMTLVWANLHGSIFLSPLIFGGYTITTGLQFWLAKEHIWLKKTQVLAVFTLINALFTILPPLGFTQYRLLWIFFWQRNFLAKFISEWAPLQADYLNFVVFSIMTALMVGSFLAFLIWKRKLKTGLWALPILPLVPLAFLANRNVYLSFIVLFLLSGWTLAQINFKQLKTGPKYALIGFLVALVGFHLWILNDQLKSDILTKYYPVAATQFIKSQHLQGHLFNEYGFGGYLLYQLYPQQQVFFDGRTDLYLCCEMPDTLKMAAQKNEPDDQYQKLLNQLWNKYDISFVLVRTQKNTVLRKVARILTTDPNWSLVFWDDSSEIFLRHDGKNDQVLKQFAVKAATPYDRDPFLPNQKDRAQKEYQQMISVVDSSKSRNALGYIDLLNNELDPARDEFNRATQLDPTNESPYMNLAELAAHDGDLNRAMELYQHAQDLAPDRGLTYIRLGQLRMENGGTLQDAKDIWQRGLQNTVDTDTKNKLQQLLSQ